MDFGEDEDNLQEDEDEDNLPEIRSRASNNISLVLFVSRTHRPVDIYWLNYQGQRVKYTTLNYGQTYFIDTFASHPWIFRDHANGSKLVANKQEIFYPPPLILDQQANHEHYVVINIDIPGRKLCWGLVD